MSSRLRTNLLMAALALALGGAGLAAAGCGDEAIEAALCRSTANKICPKWFTCFPVFSKALWPNGETQCKSGMQLWCDSSEAYTGCDIDNDKLRKCNNGIAGSQCGSLPAECQQILTCYGNNK